MATNAAKNRFCILHCRGSAPLHRFPKDEISRNVWLKQLGIKHAVITKQCVCDRHFSERMKRPGGVQLNPWAIPDINLPVQIDLSDSDEYLQEEPIDIPEEYTNGYAMEQSKIDESQNNIANDDEMDFDVLLAQVHCISDLTKNRTETSVSVDCDDIEEFDDDDNCSEPPLNRNKTARVTMGNSYYVHENPFSAPAIPRNITSKFKRKLIASVKKRRILYDPAHPSFSNAQKKTRTWLRIGKILKLNGNVCRELWLNMRYDYQVHVRALRQWLAGESNLRARPRIQMENELLFLWRFIPDKSHYEGSDDESIAMNATPHQGPEPGEIIKFSNLMTLASEDHAYANNQPDESVTFACKLIEAIKPYSELYDSMHPNFGDPKRKSIIWDAVSNELKEKATKCLFIWIQILLRYEFEISHQKSSYIVHKMEFMEKHILPNQKSPYKRVRTPMSEWYEPMLVKDQLSLIQSMVSSKKYRAYFLNIDSAPAMCKNITPPCWFSLGRKLGRVPELCEITWVIIQATYSEISEMRRNNHPLRDEWELESVINKFRSSILKSNKKLSKAFKSLKLPPDNVTTNETPVRTQPSPPTPPPQAAPRTPSPPPPPPPPANEITFTIPTRLADGTPMQQIVQFKLSTPLDKLPERSILDINTVLANAHIVIFTEFQKPPTVYLFTLEKRKELIAEVMARPLVFNEPCKTTRLVRVFWGEISVSIGFPAEICESFWDYSVEKCFFIDYDASFKKSEGTNWLPPPNPIFEKFQKFADGKKWGDLISVLPSFMQEISHFPLIYVDLKINSSWNRRQCHMRDVSAIWSLLGRKFPTLENPKVIWEKFKKLFLLYMAEVELSICNPWPKFWIPVLEKMTFLIHLQYKPTDPIYYVLKHQFNEEIETYRRETSGPPKLDSVTNAKAIFRVLKENDYLNKFTWLNRGRFLGKLKMFPVLYNVNHPQFGDREAKLEAWQEMALTFHCTVGECHLIFQHLLKSYLLFRARDPNQNSQVNAKYWDNMHYIYSCAVPNAADPKLLEGRTFRAELNGSTVRLAEEFQAEISVVDAKPRLVLKNFAAAVNSLPIQIQSALTHRIKGIFSNYSRLQNEEIVVDV